MKTKFSTLFAITGAVLLLNGGAIYGQASVSTTTTTTGNGTISEFGPETLVIRSEGATSPVRYSSSKTTTYVDESGAPVAVSEVKSGLPVTVHYIKEGDRMIANRVIVHKKVSTTTTTAPAAVEERTSTTTTTTK